jgi:hypothetical protein
MLALYRGSKMYIENEQKILGVDHVNFDASRKSRVKHFVDSVHAMAPDLVDASNAQAELILETAAFTAEQRKEMSSSIAARMQNTEAAPRASEGHHKLQVHRFLHDYLPDSKWKKFMDASVAFDSKMEEGTDFLLDLGCRHPNDDALKDLLAILAICHGKDSMDAVEAYENINQLRTKVTNKRLLRPAPSTLQEFPRDPSQFMRLYPRAYVECDPPVASRIDHHRIREKTRKDLMPTRNTNSAYKLAAVNRGRACPSAIAPQPASVQAMALQYILGQGNINPAVFLQGIAHASPPKRQQRLELLDASPAAICDVPAAPAAAPEAAPSAICDVPAAPAASSALVPSATAVMLACVGVPAPDPSGIQAMLTQARATLLEPKKKKKRKKDKKDKGKKKNVKADEHEDEDDEDDEDDADECDDDAPPKAGEKAKAGATATKKSKDAPEPKADQKTTPQTVILKRPAAAMDFADCFAGLPTVVDGKMAPVHYGGGKIYFRKPSTFRVYKRSTDKVESSAVANFSSEAMTKWSWTAAFKLINDDPRPVD